MHDFKSEVRRVPVTAGLILCGLLGYLIVYLNLNYAALMIRHPSVSMNIVDYFRLITPTFLHFGVLHIVFNALWCWEFGRRIEIILGRVWYILFFLALALIANLTQYYSSGSSNFGGLSGVVYGYAGFAWVAKRAGAPQLLNMPVGIFVVMFVFLILGFVGILDLFVAGKIANAAHLGGLVPGVLLALLYFHKHIGKILQFPKRSD